MPLAHRLQLPSPNTVETLAAAATVADVVFDAVAAGLNSASFYRFARVSLMLAKSRTFLRGGGESYSLQIHVHATQETTSVKRKATHSQSCKLPSLLG